MKRILSVLLAVLLLALSAVPALAAAYVQGVEMSQDEQANLETLTDTIRSTYGVEPYFLYNSGLTNETIRSFTEEYAKAVDGDPIIFAVSATTYYLYVSPAAEEKTSVTTDDQDSLYAFCRNADERGETYTAAVQYYSALNTLLARRALVSMNTDPMAQADVPELFSTEKNRLMDEASLLSNSEKTLLKAKLDEISERLQFDVVVRTVEDFPGDNIADWAEVWYDASDFGFGNAKDGCMLTISMAERDWCITSTGFGETALDPYSRAYIGDEIVSDLSDGDYADAFSDFAGYVDKFVTQARIGEPYGESNPYKEPFNVGGRIVIALIIGLVVSGIVTLSILGRYKPVKLKSGAADYMVSGSLQVTGSYDRFLYKNVVRTKKASSSSGGSSTSSSGRSTSGKF